MSSSVRSAATGVIFSSLRVSPNNRPGIDSRIELHAERVDMRPELDDRRTEFGAGMPLAVEGVEIRMSYNQTRCACKAAEATVSSKHSGRSL
jgi:hypothetical protein